MIVARRDMMLNGKAVVAGQVLDGIWPDLREMARRNLLRQRWVELVHDGEEPKIPNWGPAKHEHPHADPADHARIESYQPAAPQAVEDKPKPKKKRAARTRRQPQEA